MPLAKWTARHFDAAVFHAPHDLKKESSHECPYHQCTYRARPCACDRHINLACTKAVKLSRGRVSDCRRYTGVDASITWRAVGAWLRHIRHYIRSQRCDWRATIDALRPATPILWASLPLAEQRRFLRHLRPYWDGHRHRLAPFVGDHLQALAEAGQLVRHVGRVMGYREDGNGVDVVIKRRGLNELSSLRVDAVVNCSGSERTHCSAI